MKNLKNKKGFTLVELLAVIVILALIMAIAVYSISGILQSSRESAFKDTALNIISGVRQQLLINNELRNGDYYVTSSLLESGGITTPYGGTINYSDKNADYADAVPGTKAVMRANGTATCSVSSPTFVSVSGEGTGSYTYSICIGVQGGKDGDYYINMAKESDLMGSKTDMIVKAGSTTTPATED